MEALDIVKTAFHALDDKKAEGITVLDIAEISTIADYFVIAGATSTNQMRALQEAVEEELGKQRVHARQIEGNSKSSWILMDYQDVIIHLFFKEERQFYDLERIWRDGRRVELDMNK